MSRFIALMAVLTLGVAAHADELKSLRKDYDEAKTKLGGGRERTDKAKSNVGPILEKIGALDTKESLAFLLGELKAAPPEIAALCPPAILASSQAAAMKALLQGFAERPPAVKASICEALTKTDKDLKPVAGEVVQLAATVQDAEAKKSLPGLLAKVGTVAAAKAILAGVATGKAVKGEDPQQAYNTRAAAALATIKDEETHKWLGGGAFTAAGSDPAKGVVVSKVAGELKLEDARSHLEKLIGHPSPEVGTAAITALTKIGIGDAADKVATALEKRKGKGDVSFRIQALDALAATGSDGALEIVLKFAHGSDADMRAVAMGSLGLFRQNPKAIEGLAKGLEDEDPAVRATALRSLARFREKAVIEPLIDFLGKEKEQRLKVNALEILVPLTGQNMGLEHQDWKKWWTVAADKFEPPKDGEKGTTQVKVHDLSYFGIEVSSRRMAFLVDISSSMLADMTVTPRSGKEADEEEEEDKGKTGVAEGGKKGGGDGAGAPGPNATRAKRIEVLKREMVRLIKKLPTDTQINILTFHGSFKAWQDQLQPLAGPGRERAVQFVEGLQTGTGTNVFDTLEAALKDKRCDTIYLLTDGEPTRGRITQGPAIIEEIKSMNRLRGATIHCIGFGEDSPFLKQLAEENGGKYRFVDKY